MRVIGCSLTVRAKTAATAPARKAMMPGSPLISRAVRVVAGSPKNLMTCWATVSRPTLGWLTTASVPPTSAHPTTEGSSSGSKALRSPPAQAAMNGSTTRGCSSCSIANPGEAAEQDDQPGPHVLDRIEVRAEEPRKRLLDGVLGFAVAAQQSIAHVQQEAVVIRPGLRDPGVVLDHLASPRLQHALRINTRTG